MAKKTKKVVVVGSSNIDMVVKSQRIPAPGETVIGGNFVSAAGGKGANQAVAAARIGGKVTFIARVGADTLGNRAIAGYKKERIKTKFIFRDEEHVTGVALVLVDAKGENLISVASGANAFLTPADIERAESAIAAASVVVTQLETPLDVLDCTVKLAKKHGVPLLLDPAPAPDEPLPTEILRNVTCIKPNKNEAERLTGCKITNAKSALHAAAYLLELGIKKVIITLGSDGCLFADTPGKGVQYQGYKVEAVDTTAAGDAFSGALAYAIADRWTMDDAARLANVAAALSVSKLGAQPSLPTMREIEDFMLGEYEYNESGET